MKSTSIHEIFEIFAGVRIFWPIFLLTKLRTARIYRILINEGGMMQTLARQNDENDQ